MNIRIAEKSDLNAIVEIYNQAIVVGQKTADLKPFTVDQRKQWFDEHVPDKYPILVAEENKIILGYLTISKYRSGRSALLATAEVSFFVNSQHHRQGVASRLLQHVIDICPTIHKKTLFAIIIDTNQRSANLLEKFGFSKWGHMPNVAEFDGVEVGHLYYGLRVS